MVKSNMIVEIGESKDMETTVSTFDTFPVVIANEATKKERTYDITMETSAKMGNFFPTIEEYTEIVISFNELPKKYRGQVKGMVLNKFHPFLRVDPSIITYNE